MRKLTLLACWSICLLSAWGWAATVEDYGLLPSVRAVSISPDGKHYAFIQRVDDSEVFVVVDADTLEVVGGANASELKARNIFFASNRHVVIVASETTSIMGIRGNWEENHALLYDIESGAMAALLRRVDNLFPAQGGLGRIVGTDPDSEHVFVPAFIGGRRPSYHLLRVDLETGVGHVHAFGTGDTTDWFVNADGEVVAREEFDQRKNLHTVHSKLSGEWREVFEQETEIPEIQLRALAPDAKHLIFTRVIDGQEGVYRLSLDDGAVEGPLHAATDSDIEAVQTRGFHREYIGVLRSGLRPTYDLEVPELTEIIAQVQDTYPASSVYLRSLTQDLSKLVFAVSGRGGAQDYLLFEPESAELVRIARGYPEIDHDQIGDITAIRYSARDGLKIPAILTWPVGVETREDLPLLAFPHGGPDAYDSIRFDWWAQFFARQGYLVMQPNFRGSSGHGHEFRSSGWGEWGRKMQDDVTDGVNALVNAGYADPDRVCIMGASYGGYSALAGGAFTPELYRCVIAVAGVSDLPRMLRDTRSLAGRDHWVVSYWEQRMGDSKDGREKLRAISPVNFAASFKAPVLLIHGKDDSVVPLRQSLRMESALKKAGKPVSMIRLAGEDHWLSRSPSRLETLTAIWDFLKEHNPP